MFLVDGNPKGVVTAEIMNWSGHALSAPRERLPEVLRRPEAKRTGVYLLFSDPLDAYGRREVYVGETDDVGKRLTQHNKDDDKEFFESFCILTSKDQNLTKAHARYLANRVTDMARGADRSNVLNRTEPAAGSLPESDVSDMEFFLTQVEIVLPVLGFDILRVHRGTAQTEARQQGSEQGFSMPEAASGKAEIALVLAENRRGLRATAILSDGEVVVSAGSLAARDSSEYHYPYKDLRQRFETDGTLMPTERSEHLSFMRDVVFNSPSAASATIFGRSDNGRKSWRLATTGQSLKDYQVSLAEAVE